MNPFATCPAGGRMAQSAGSAMREVRALVGLTGCRLYRCLTSHMVDESARTVARSRGWLRRLYDWTVSWAERPGGAWALFGIAFLESSVFPVPPDVLLLALSVGAPRRALWFALVCSVGSVLGGIFGYALGYFAWEAVRGWFIPYVFSQSAFDHVAGLYNRNAFVAILSAAFTPIPYKVFTVAAGVCGVNLWTLVVASILGRSGRFFLVGGAVYLFGPHVKTWIERYFDWVAWAVLILAIGGFLALKYLR
ncbi:MAG: YqaA family protein [Verrucomicrobiota bacterium]|nr:DedA family protein [Limisphaera sp.]MDW8381245.1 YqaA family protein [Verrucomicrobiota bacterium]